MEMQFKRPGFVKFCFYAKATMHKNTMPNLRNASKLFLSYFTATSYANLEMDMRTCCMSYTAYRNLVFPL